MDEHVIDTKFDGGLVVLRRGLQFLRLVLTILHSFTYFGSADRGLSLADHVLL
jgi:hypothetical protein